MLSNLEMEDGMNLVYNDILCSSKMQELDECLLTTNDIVLSSLLNREQLYQNKKSDMWILIWILHKISPNHHYWKGHVFPGTIIPGPNKPKNINSFLF